MYWKKLFSLCVITSFAIAFNACSYDDDDVWDAINDQDERIVALERWQETTNSNIAALQAIVNGNDFIKSVTPINEGGKVIGYTISFLKQGDVNIYYGEKGEKGEQGDKGDKGDQGDTGKNGETPVISVTKGDDGNWYWTLNGELLKDASGNSIPANGKDGENGNDGENAPLPQLKTGAELGSGYIADAVYLSIDGGKSWTKVSGDKGADGSNGSDGSDAGNIFDVNNPILDQGTYWQFVLANGFRISVPKYVPFYLDYLDASGNLIGTAQTGKLEVEASKPLTLRYFIPQYYSMNVTWVAFDSDNNKKTDITTGEDPTLLSVPALNIGESFTIIFSVTAEDNRTTFYKVTVVTREAALIEATKNQELANALADAFGLSKDENGNVIITTEIVNNTTTLQLKDRSLESLNGIENFKNLTELDCSGNNLTIIDGANLPSSLKVLNCSNNPLLELNLEGLNHLTDLNCSRCFNQTTSRTSGNTIINTIDLSSAQELNSLDCSYNKFTVLNTSANTKLVSLSVQNNDLTDLDLANNPKIKYIRAYYNQLTSINITNLHDLLSLNLQYNRISSINLENNMNLLSLNCANNNLTTFSVNHITPLRSLFCQGNKLTTLDVSNLHNISTLRCGIQQNNINLSLILNDVQKTTWENQWKDHSQNGNVTVK